MRVLLRWTPRQHVDVAFGFEWRDLWVGLFIDPSPGRLRLFLCLIPCFPLRITWGYPQ